MYILKSAGLALAAATLMGCATGGGGSAGNCDTLCTAQKALTIAYNGHDTLVQLTNSTHASGALVGSTYDTVKGYLNGAKVYLDAAKTATDAATIMGDIGQAETVEAQAKPLIGSK